MKIHDNLIHNLKNDNYFLYNFLPLGLSFSFLSIGGRLMKKILYNDLLKDVNQKELFDYLISRKVFVDSLTDDELKKYYKFFKKTYRNRFYSSIKQSFCFLFFGRFE